MNIIGIESSCDETSIAVICDGKLIANLISSQDFHNEYGGVVPELSSRAHLQIIIPLLKKALQKANLNLNEINLVTATAGPGLIGALLVGFTFGKALAYSLNVPFIPVNHIEGHIYSGFLMNDKPEFPYLCLVVSGGHTLLLLVKSDNDIEQLGSTIDDAAGEAFDKVAKMMELGYPGGKEIQELAKSGDINSIEFPVAKCKGKYDFSFSGLKTAVLRYLQKNFPEKKMSHIDKANIAASFQFTVVKSLLKNVELALTEFDIKSVTLVGGVAANQLLRNELENLAIRNNVKCIIPDIEYCGDNAAMIAYRGLKIFESGKKFDLTVNAFPSLIK